jgi:UTP--glucose-1-phosphate uridylyltransferase
MHEGDIEGMLKQADVRKAVIPAAGFGTRMFPASKAIRKEMFPIVDRDGLAKPAILLIVEEVISAGIERVILIVQREDLPVYESLFREPIRREWYDKLPETMRRTADRMAEIGERLQFVVQEEQDGFGHAVFSARDAVDEEPFLLMLGDHLCRSDVKESCAAQMVSAFRRHGASHQPAAVLGLIETPEAEISHFGAAAGDWIEPGRLLHVTTLMEKPTPGDARARLRMPGLPDGGYLTAFGQYVLPPRIFDHLDGLIRDGSRERGEFQLTTALDRMRAEEGLTGLIVRGKRFDIGLPAGYLSTLREWGSSVLT